MIKFVKNNYLYKIYSWLPLIILYISVLNEFDMNYSSIEFISFNFPFVLIFYFTLKESNNFDYFLVFLAGLFNDTVVGIPLGLSSLSYVLICIFASYLRNMTIRPNLMKDWFYFLFIISLINSLNYLIMFLFFSYDLKIMFYMINNLFTFLIYIPLTFIFDYYMKGLNE